jgi:ATP-dependent exoDNAse (exonuclease V) beta subunit
MREHEAQPAIFSSGEDASGLYPRHVGGPLSRALGTAVHAFLEELTRLLAEEGAEDLDWNPARTALASFEPRVAAQVRAAGIEPTQSTQIAAQALSLTLDASHDPIGQWILSPHADAASEASWAGVVGGALRTVRADRVFRAGIEPRSEGEQALWIVDYKTAHADHLDPAVALPQLRRLFAPQLEAYAAVLRNLHGADAILRAALYYPRVLLLDWWDL